MQHAKRMVLVDEKLLESLQNQSWQKPMRQLLDRQETRAKLSWKKPADVRSKTNLHMNMKDIAADDTLPDDVKSKLYTQELCRFQRIKPPKRSIKQEVDDIRPAEAKRDITVADLIDIDTVIDAPIIKRAHKRKAVAKAYTPAVRTRSQRKRKVKAVPFDWVEY